MRRCRAVARASADDRQRAFPNACYVSMMDSSQDGPPMVVSPTGAERWGPICCVVTLCLRWPTHEIGGHSFDLVSTLTIETRSWPSAALFPRSSTIRKGPYPRHSRIEAATTTFPWLSQLLGTDRRKPLASAAGGVSYACATLLVQVSHLSASACRAAKRGMGMIHRARAFIVRLLLGLQASSFMLLIQFLADFRFAAEGPNGNCNECVTVVSMSHSWDETKQMLRQPVQNKYARQSTQPVGRTIMVQRGMVSTSATLEHSNGVVQRYTRAEAVIIPPTELYGKSMPYVLGGFRRGLLFPAFNKDKVKDIAGKVSAVVLTFLGDAAASNRRVLKHMVGLSQEDEWPGNVLLDVGQLCMLHQVHRIKIGLVEVHGTVSMMYCLSKLVKAGAVMPLVADYIGGMVTKKCRRVVAPPPPEGVAQARRLMDMLYKLDAQHHILHGQNGERKTQLVQDIETLLSLDNGGFNRSGDIVHYCWNGRGGGCCTSEEQTAEKLTGALLNVFVSRAVPVGTLSRWTHITTICTMLCANYACRDLLASALLHGLEEDQHAEEQAAQKLPAFAAGAGDDDIMAQHRARKEKVRQWLSRPETRVQVACLCLMLQTLDTVSYYLMGGERQEGRHRQPGTIPRVEQPLPAREFTERVRRALVAFSELLQSYGEAGSACNFFLIGMGLGDDDLQADGSMRTFRRQMVGASAGVFRRLALRLRTFPVMLWWLVEPGVDEARRQQVAREFFALRSCCLGVFGRGLKRECPTPELLLGVKGQAIVQGWLESQTWTIYACEKEHASCRRLVLGGGGPARHWSYVARERVMECARSIHIQRCSIDPASAPAARGLKRRSGSPAAASDADLSPLHDVRPEAPGAIVPWSQLSQGHVRGAGAAEPVDGVAAPPGPLASAGAIVQERASVGGREALGQVVPEQHGNQGPPNGSATAQCRHVSKCRVGLRASASTPRVAEHKGTHRQRALGFGHLGLGKLACLRHRARRCHCKAHQEVSRAICGLACSGSFGHCPEHARREVSLRVSWSDGTVRLTKPIGKQARGWASRSLHRLRSRMASKRTGTKFLASRMRRGNHGTCYSLAP